MTREPSAAYPGILCWCGCRQLEAFCDSHLRCPECETLVSTETENSSHYATVGDDESGFYGAPYWTTHVPETLGDPTLEQRARSDLTERAIDWLCRILELSEPPATVLELGCAHARLAMLLRRAGFDAEGLELSPHVVRRARELSGVPVHVGPLESAAVNEHYDVIAAMDVLEHLVDPVGTLGACRALLPDAGLLVLQTPCHRGEDETWEMLIPEHLYLFNDTGIRSLLERADFAEVEISEAYFPYDMWVVASPRGPIRQREDPHLGLDPLLMGLIDGLAARNRLESDLAWSEKERRELQLQLENRESSTPANHKGPESDSRMARLRRDLGRKR